MAGWIAANQRPKPGAFERIDKDMGSILSPKPTLNLMQNCDLPPPIKLFSGADKTFHSSISKIYSRGGGQEAEEDEQLHMNNDCSENDKLEVLKALRLSQTRAREAERKLGVLSKEKDALSNLLVDESLRLFAHRQWVNLLEFQVFKLQRQQQEENRQSHYSMSNSAEWVNLLEFQVFKLQRQQQEENRQSHYSVSNSAEKSSYQEDYEEGTSSKNWCVAIAFCLAIAGMGFAFGCRYLF
ncbi:hypothetical protein Pfo_007858 [Paulownia fortunei]|nr:hypothetical protein Pfo_007858 [Paulownia fortunei]